MISDSSTSAPQQSRRESGSIAIQDRMRAMANALAHSHVVQQPLGSAEAEDNNDNNKNNSVGVETGRRRSSVIDMWRQREMSVSCNHLNKPIPLRKTSSDRGFRHTEEKKEHTPEEDLVESESHEKASTRRFSNPASVTPRRVLLPPTPRGTSPLLIKREAGVSPSTPTRDRTTTRNTWKKQESPLDDDSKRMHGTVAVTCKEESPSSKLSKSSIRWSGASSDVVHDEWEQTEQEPDEPAKISPTASPKLAQVTRAVPVTPDDTESPAFSDLKSKWAKFGAQKFQARVGTKGPSNVVPPVVHKVASNNSQRSTRSLARGCDESSIDGDEAVGTTQGQSNKMDLQGGTSATVQQEPALQDPDPVEIPNASEKTSKRKSSRPDPTTPQDQDSPVRKVATYMYTKGRPNMASRVSREINNNDPEENSTFVPRMNALPKRMLHRKILMDKHRRRSKGVGTSINSTLSSVSNDEDALNEAFDKTCAENETFDFPIKRAVTDPLGADNPTPMITSRIPIQTLMAFGAAEDEFLAAESTPQKATAHLPFDQQQQEEEYGYIMSKSTDNTDELASEAAPSPLPPQSAIAARAQKTLRDKRSRPKPSGRSSDRTSVPLKEPNFCGMTAPRASVPLGCNEPNFGGTTAPQASAPLGYNEPNVGRTTASRASEPLGYTEDEMMALDQEREENVTPRAKRVIERSNGPSDEFKLSCGTRFWGDLQEPQPSATFDESVATSTTSQMLSIATSASDVTSVKDDHIDTSRSRDSLLDGEDLVTDQFVSESNTHAEAFAASFQSLSLSQLANDLKEEAGSVLKGVDFKKLSSNWNEGVAAASQSLGQATSRLNELVSTTSKDVFAKTKPQPTVSGRAPSPVEEIAIEVEYVEDSDDGEGYE